ncbi:MAG: glutamine--tRNA ligase, partial [bacterium]
MSKPPKPSSPAAAPAAPSNFIRSIIEEDQRSGRHGGKVTTRFPPEPNGYLHIGHAKSICLNFGVARDFGGRCHMRFDDTNPAKEETEYVESIMSSVRWMGFDWGEHLHFASDYFQQLYDYAELLVTRGDAYVDSLSADEIRAYRGTLTEPGRDSPYRTRTPEENLDLLRRMKAGEFPDGAHVLRLKLDMRSPNINLRDPLIYRIRHQTHHRTGDAWCIYPLYDYTHALSDAIEHITHSICTLEFEDHRPLYDWCVENLPVPYRPYQYEFARLNLTYAVLSKRRLIDLVESGCVDGWDDPRLPTLVGVCRRGYTPEGMQLFCERIGVSKADSWIDIGVLEQAIRDDLEPKAPRASVVLSPLRLVIDNFPAGRIELC